MKSTRSYEEDYARYKRREYWFHASLLIVTFIPSIWLLGPIGFLLWLPLATWYISRAIVKSAENKVDDLRRQKYAHKGGTHHSFDDQEVRLFCDPDGTCRVAANDIFKILNHRMTALDYRKLATRFAPVDFLCDRENIWWFTESAAIEWISVRSAKLDKEAMRFQRWLERETFPPMRRKHELGIVLSPPEPIQARAAD